MRGTTSFCDCARGEVQRMMGFPVALHPTCPCTRGSPKPSCPHQAAAQTRPCPRAPNSAPVPSNGPPRPPRRAVPVHSGPDPRVPARNPSPRAHNHPRPDGQSRGHGARPRASPTPSLSHPCPARPHCTRPASSPQTPARRLRAAPRPLTHPASC